MFILDIKRYKNWAHKPAPENILTIWRSVLPDFPTAWAQSASFLISTLNSFQEVLKISSWAAHNWILVELDGKCPWQVPICSWHEQGTKRFEIKAVLGDQLVHHGQYYSFRLHFADGEMEALGCVAFPQAHIQWWQSQHLLVCSALWA